MTIFRSEEGLVGLVALGVVPWIGWILLRSMKEGRLPIGRAYVRRDERPGAYRLLFLLWVAAVAMAAVIALDLLAGVSVWRVR